MFAQLELNQMLGDLAVPHSATRWSSRGLFPPNLEGYVANSALQKALKLIARVKLTSDERVVLHRMGWRTVLKLTRRACGANPATLELGGAWAHQIGDSR